jgi:hypothetical protein
MSYYYMLAVYRTHVYMHYQDGNDVEFVDKREKGGGWMEDPETLFMGNCYQHTWSQNIHTCT